MFHPDSCAKQGFCALVARERASHLLASMTHSPLWKVDAKSRLVGILGYPVAHSLSPLIHNAAFRAQGLNCRYVALPVRKENLPAAVSGLLSLGFLGANVTLPHKQAVLPLMDALSERARAVGAVNTIVCRDAALYGDNTDVAGFLEPLKPHEGRLRGASMVILGSGGAARAVAYALLSCCAPRSLTLAARRRAPAERIIADLAAFDPIGAMRFAPMKEAAPEIRGGDLVVNTTPVGMHPHADASPWPDPSDFREGQLVYDLVYRPQETRLLRDAARQGGLPVGGISMLVHQAAASYVQWIRQPMPLDSARKALESVI